MNTDNVIEDIDQNVQEIGELAGIQPSEITANPANTDFFVENIDTNVKAIAETLDVTPYEVEADPANTDFFVENIAKNVDLIKDNFSGGGDVTIEALTVTENGTFQEEGKAYTPVTVNVPVPEYTIMPTKISIGGQSGDIVIRPRVAIDISSSLTSLESMFAQDRTITSIEFSSGVDLSNVTTIQGMCNGDTLLNSVVLPSTLKPLNCTSAFYNCNHLSVLPAIDTSNATTMQSMFSSCSRASVRHVYDMSSLEGMYNHTGVFSGVGSASGYTLDQESVDYILQSILTATNVTGNKTWKYVTNNTSTSVLPEIQASQYYQAFLDAGWTIQ